MKSVTTLLLSTWATALVGCTSIQLNPEGNFVRIVQSAEPNCDRLGTISGQQGNLLTGPLTTQANLTLGARNDLVNGAVSIGADTVVLSTTLPDSTLLSVGYRAEAYRCLHQQVAVR